jgi:hypothetical protein
LPLSQRVIGKANNPVAAPSGGMKQMARSVDIRRRVLKSAGDEMRQNSVKSPRLANVGISDCVSPKLVCR